MKLWCLLFIDYPVCNLRYFLLSHTI